MSEQKHTELPWCAESTSVAEMYDIKVHCSSLATTFSNPHIPSNAKHDAEFIVLACNNHYKLVEALEALLPPVEEYDGCWVSDLRAIQQARQALAEVKS